MSAEKLHHLVDGEIRAPSRLDCLEALFKRLPQEDDTAPSMPLSAEDNGAMNATAGHGASAHERQLKPKPKPAPRFKKNIQPPEKTVDEQKVNEQKIDEQKIDEKVPEHDNYDSGFISGVNSNITPPPVPSRAWKVKTLEDETEQQSSGTEVEADGLNDESSRKTVDFALKMGFTKQECYLAIQKLGANADHNALLQQLIEQKENSCSSFKLSELDSSLSSADTDSSIGDSNGLRSIVIDGSNVAMHHGNGEVFSCKGIQLAVDWFRERGHRNITVFVPVHRLSSGQQRVKDQHLLKELKHKKVVVVTPSRKLEGKRLTCYDDRFILKLASDTKSVVLSNDRFRDLIGENPAFKETIATRVLPYTFVEDRFLPAEDPLGRQGPTLDQMLRVDPMNLNSDICPYGRKCTYGSKCKYRHPEREGRTDTSSLEDFKLIGSKHSVPPRVALPTAYSPHQELYRGRRSSEQYLQNGKLSDFSYQEHTSLPSDFYPLRGPHSLSSEPYASYPGNFCVGPASGHYPVSRGVTTADSRSRLVSYDLPSIGERTHMSWPSRVTSSQEQNLNVPYACLSKAASDNSLLMSAYYDETDSVCQSQSNFPHPYSQRHANRPLPYDQQAAPQAPPHLMVQNIAQPVANTSYSHDDMPIAPTDPRYNIYFHLKGLFPEHKVRHVMNRMPTEMDSSKLCAAILALK